MLGKELFDLTNLYAVVREEKTEWKPFFSRFQREEQTLAHLHDLCDSLWVSRYCIPESLEGLRTRLRWSAHT